MVDGEKTKEHLGALLSNFISALKKSTQTPQSKRSCVRAKVGGKPPDPATASALSNEMLTTQDIPNALKFSIGPKLIGISQKMKKKIVEGRCEEQKQYFRFYRKSDFFFLVILMDFHSEGALTVYLLADKKTNTKTTTKKKTS